MSGELSEETGGDDPESNVFDIEAERLIRQYSRQFASDLIVRAEEIALVSHRRRITRQDVMLASLEVNQERKRTSGREFSMLFGSACLGAAIQGSITEFGMVPLRPLLLGVYIALGVLGLGLIFYGMRR